MFCTKDLVFILKISRDRLVVMGLILWAEVV